MPVLAIILSILNVFAVFAPFKRSLEDFLVQNFMPGAGKIPLLACHPASAGHGLNLQDGGNVVVWHFLEEFHISSDHTTSAELAFSWTLDYLMRSSWFVKA